MNELIAPALSVFGAVVGGYAGVKISLARLEERVRRIEQEIGTHETGLRGTVHDHTAALLKLDGRVTALEQADE